MGGERFCVRNSGAEAVVEGVGDHGCEYMTGGRAIIIGGTGRNFAAGMSGGIAFVFDPHNRLPGRCNTDMVDLDRLESEEDEACVQRLLTNHVRYTKSPVAERILRDWATTRTQFVKVMPRDYKHVLAAIARARAAGLPEDEAVMEASHG
jgi:glutamate synthase (NADPH/NADH) large chain